MKKTTLFGERLRAAREEANLTQEQLAQKLGIHKQAVSRYEQNLREPEYDTLIQISIILDKSIDYLLGRTEEKK